MKTRASLVCERAHYLIARGDLTLGLASERPGGLGKLGVGGGGLVLPSSPRVSHSVGLGSGQVV